MTLSKGNPCGYTLKQIIYQGMIYLLDELVILVCMTYFALLKAINISAKEWIHGDGRFRTFACTESSGGGDKNLPIMCWKQGVEKSLAAHSSSGREVTRFLSPIGNADLSSESSDGYSAAGEGFSFSAAGFLFPYYLGATQCLMEHGYITENTPLAGSSAGAIVCGAIVCGVSVHEALDATKQLSQECRTNGTLFKLRDLLRIYFNRYLPPNGYLRANGRMRVAITQVFGSPKGILVDHFNSNEDLIDAVLASCFIPGFVAARPCTLFRGEFVLDGGITYFTPPTSAKKTIGISAFQTDRLGLEDVQISPHLNPQIAVSPSKILSLALKPPTDSTIDKLFDMGYTNARAWVDNRALQKVVRVAA